MKLLLDGYRTLRLLRATRHAQVFAALREADQRTVVAKVYELATDEGIEARVEHEFRLIQGLEVEGVVQALALERAGDRLTLILDWCEGRNLEEHAGGRPLAIAEFLDIALQVTDNLTKVHNHRVIHRDIKPTNLLIDPETKKVWIADFGISVLLESERENLNDPDVVEGTLPYVSPEQTGRTRHEVDFRSDLYSLGVTFYELLTGRRPFCGDSPLELIHSHLARRAEPPQRIRPEVPKALDEIVMKLLEKAPEHRYQSARGLHRDLMRLAEALTEGRELDEFTLGSEDIPTALQLPAQLYGREAEIELLARELRAATRGRPRAVAFVGPGGIGKSALIETLHEPVMVRRGYLARGKFTRELRDKPYAGFISVFSSLADQLLTESDEALERWRVELRRELGALAGDLTELAPKLKTVLDHETGHMPGPVEAHARLPLACARIIAAFAKPEHPLVLALDDLHWADAASCELLATVLAEPGAALLVVVTLRGDELSPSNPLREIHELLEHERNQLQTVHLQPLGRDHVVRLIAHALARPVAEVETLAELVARKTNSNPFFVRQFLAHLVELELLVPGEYGWTWNERAIESAGIPDDLLAMMTDKLGRLAPPLRQLLVHSAVIGSRFDRATLEGLVSQTDEGSAGGSFGGMDGPIDVDAGIIQLVDEGLVATTEDGQYAFTHDRIREVAYHMAGPARRIELHRTIGAQRLERVEIPELSENIFELVDHIDLGYGLIPLVDESPADAAARAEASIAALDDFEREHLAELNSLAGYKALTSSAATVAARYLGAGVQLLADGSPFPAPGAPGHRLRFALELGLCQALALSNEYTRAEASFTSLLDAPLSPDDIGRAVSKHIEMRSLVGEYALAVKTGLDGLARLGLEQLPDFDPEAAGERVGAPRHEAAPEPCPDDANPDPDADPNVAQLRELLPALAELEVEGMRKRKRIREPQLKAVLDVLTALAPVASNVDRELHLHLACRHLELLLAHGRHPSAPLALVQVASLVSARLGRRGFALELAQVARQLAAREGSSCPRHRVEPSYWQLRTWLQPYAQALTPLRDAVGIALEVGDLEYAGHTTAMHISVGLASGLHLRTLERTAEVAVHRLQQWGTQSFIPTLLAHYRFANALLEGKTSTLDLDDPLGMAEHEGALPHARARYTVRALEATLTYVLGHPERSLAILDHAPACERVLPEPWHLANLALIRGLSAAAVYASRPEAERAPLRAAVEAELQRLRAWAEDGAHNFEHLALLLEAELCALDDPDLAAFARFVAARRAAAQRRDLLVEAIALERLATLARDAGLDELASGPIREARGRYHYWGAFTKTAAIEAQWPELSSERARYEERDLTHTGPATHGYTSNSTSTESLDLSSVHKISQAIAEAIELDQVVERIMAVAIENAGADRGVLLLAQQSGHLSVVLSARADGDAAESQSMLDAPVPIEEAAEELPITLVRWVERTREALTLDDAISDLRFANDAYIQAERVRSVMCVPIVNHGQLMAVLYLENKLSPGSFGVARLRVLHLLMAQAGSALENARLFDALRSSEVRWRSLVEGLPDVVMQLDRRGAIVVTNQLSEFSPRHVAHSSVLEFVSDEHRPGLRRAIAQVIQEARGQELELEAELPGLDPCWYTLRLSPIQVDGRVDSIVCVATDISERREAAAAKAKLEAQLRQQQRLESIDTLASGVAHEINNPVQGIMNYAELIATSADIDELNREFAEEIRHESERVAAIVRNLLAFSRQEGDRGASPATLVDVAEGTLSLVRTVLRKNQIVLRVDIPEDLPKVRCRVQQIQQVIMNLVTNARDALEARYPDFDERKAIELRGSTFTRAGAPWVRLSVTDYGGGVPEAVVSSIFDPFFTTKGRDKGTGLGLAVSHGIVAEHRGELRLENRPGKSASFHIELPAVTGD